MKREEAASPTTAVPVPAGDLDPRDRMLRALAGKDVDRVPLWFMRQAGRYLPEYRELRERHPFEERLHDPELAARITLQPLHRYPLDAAVLFSDILVPFGPMGHPAVFQPGGPRIHDPVRTPEQVDGLGSVDPQRDLAFVGDALGLVREAIPDHAVLGFAGAPFTLACYLVQGGGDRSFAAVHGFAHAHPDAWHRLMDTLARTAGAHLAYQARCGADAVQLFDTWAELLSAHAYRELVLPHVRTAATCYRDAGATAPLLLFTRGTTHLLDLLPEAGADAWSVDWRTDLAAVRRACPEMPLQGNLDPTLLFAPPAVVRRETRRVLEALGGRAHVFNLGHGILPGTPLAGVQAMVDEVQAWRP